MCFCVSLDHFGFCILSFVGFFSQDIGWEERLRRVEWDVKPWSIHLLPQFFASFYLLSVAQLLVAGFNVL